MKIGLPNVGSRFQIAAILCLAALSAPAYAQVSLGEAANYAVLGRNINLHNVTVNGDGGVGSNGKISIGGPSDLNGDLYLDDGATYQAGGGLSGSVIQPYDVDKAITDAIHASQIAAGLAPNIVYSSITGPLMIQSSGPQTVVKVTGDINLSGGDSVIFNGAATDQLILNVYGGFTMGGDASIESSAFSATSNNILINIIGTGSRVSTHVGNMVEGTLMALNRSFELHSVNGAVIGGDLEMKLMSDATVNYQILIPEPSSVMCVGMSALLLFRRKRK